MVLKEHTFNSTVRRQEWWVNLRNGVNSTEQHRVFNAPTIFSIIFGDLKRLPLDIFKRESLSRLHLNNLLIEIYGQQLIRSNALSLFNGTALFVFERLRSLCFCLLLLLLLASILRHLFFLFQVQIQLLLVCQGERIGQFVSNPAVLNLKNLED